MYDNNKTLALLKTYHETIKTFIPKFGNLKHIKANHDIKKVIPIEKRHAIAKSAQGKKKSGEDLTRAINNVMFNLK